MSARSAEKPVKLKIVEMDHIVIRCTDIERQINFYINILGLEPYRMEEYRAGKVRFPCARINKDTVIDLFPFPNQEPVGDGPRNLDHFCVIIEPTDLDQLAHYLRQQGVTVDSDKPGVRSGARGMGTSIYVRDFEGNKIELRYY